MTDSPYIEIEVVTEFLVDRDAETLSRSKVRLPRRELGLNEVLRMKLSQEIHAFNERRIEAYGAEYLSPGEFAIVLSEGRELLGDPLKKGKANPEIEYRHMLRAFHERKFKVTIDGVEAKELETRLELGDDSRISFIRLVPYR